MSDNVKKPEQVNLSINYEDAAGILAGFIEDCVVKSSAEKAVIGLSGGLDSAVTAALAVKGLGADRVLGVIMPYRTSSPESEEDAKLLAGHFGISAKTVDISPMVDAFSEITPGIDSHRLGNIMARQRMIVLYDVSAAEKGIVIGTSNKSELLLGYGTIFGDMACAVNPVGDVYKTQLRELAEHLGIPERIRKKTPTADLEAGQTDESDLGFTYADADQLLYLWIDKRYTLEELKEYGFDPEFIAKVTSRVRRNHFKRIPPLIAKISARTIGHEFRYAWEWAAI